jgi:mannose-1-phosphate guanylyltransferase
MRDNSPPIALIMAGGVGSRFWPASRESQPKQFLDVLGMGRNLLQMTYDRLNLVFEAQHIYIITHAQYRELVQDSLPALPPENILCESHRRNTAPAIAYAAWTIAQKYPQSPLFVSASDHLVTREKAFTEALQKGLDYVRRNNKILTLGIQAHRPDTGYGYLECGAEWEEGIYQLVSFKEKPDLATAQQYLDSGQYYWNSGNFFFSLPHLQAEFKRHCPEIYTLREEGGDYALNPDVSIDYALMEKTREIATLPVDIGWSDVGTWKSLYELQASPGQNIVQPQEKVHLQDCRGNLIRTDGKLEVYALGIENTIVVQDGDLLMLLPMDREQEVKTLMQMHKNRE